MKVTARQIEALRAYALRETVRGAADELGISNHTARNLILVAYKRLGVHTAIGAFRVLGWLSVPQIRQGGSQ